MKDEIKVFAPATVANTGCAFDVLGFCIESPGDEVLVRLKSRPGVRIHNIIGDNGVLPYDPNLNTAGVAAMAFLDYLNTKQGIEIEIHKKLPVGSGLGSSAASAVGCVVAINILLGNPLKKQQLLPFVLEAERIACGTAHADNAAPSLLGGFVLIRSYSPLDLIEIVSPEKLFCSLIYPHVEIKTSEARRVLKREIPLQDAIIQWGNVGGLIAGLMTSDYNLIGRSLQDVVAEPCRSQLIPGFQDIKDAALKTDALGCSISGSGPSIFALSTSEQQAREIADAMQAACWHLKIKNSIFVSRINQEGARIIM